MLKKGDTLYSISRKFKSDIFSLSSLNRLNNVNQIKVNQKILIPDNFSKVIEKKINKKKRLSYQKKMLLKKIITKKIQKKFNFIWPVKGKILNQFGSQAPGFFNDGINMF